MNIKNLKPRHQSRYEQGYVDPSACKKLFDSLRTQPIIFRSSYEKKFVLWLESSPQVKHWGSECFNIPYYSVLDQKMHNYYPDYFVEMMNGDKIVVEVKPHNQTVKPVNENCWAAREYVRNVCKWQETIKFCNKKGYKFKIITEKTINKL